MAAKIYGIKNCDTIKKARKWLEANDTDHSYHDFRIDGIDKKLLNNWLKQVDWEILLNTRGTTWRKLADKDKEGMNKSKAISLMLEQPAIIKRPVLDYKNKVYVGFKADNYDEIFN